MNARFEAVDLFVNSLQCGMEFSSGCHVDRSTWLLVHKEGDFLRRTLYITVNFFFPAGRLDDDAEVKEECVIPGSGC